MATRTPVEPLDTTAVATATELLADSRTVRLISALAAGPGRFVDLRAALGAPSHSTVSKRLRALERFGVVQQVIHYEHPIRAHYQLTPQGTSLHRVIDAMARWAATYG